MEKDKHYLPGDPLLMTRASYLRTVRRYTFRQGYQIGHRALNIEFDLVGTKEMHPVSNPKARDSEDKNYNSQKPADQDVL